MHLHLQVFLVRLLRLASLAVVLAGCATGGAGAWSTTGGELVRAVDQFCELPIGARALVEREIAEEIAPHGVVFRCAVDESRPAREPVRAPFEACEPSLASSIVRVCRGPYDPLRRE